MFQLTRACDYAFRVVTRLAEFPGGQIVRLPALSYSEKVPPHFLSKILQQLTRSGYIKSHRGAAGGYSLEANPEELTLLDVVEAIEGQLMLNQCLSPTEGCERLGWCAIHEVCRDARDRVLEVFRGTTIAAVVAKNKANRAAVTAA
ncbi:MAG: Rrf2 family transcriptional regulator [Acidobacteriia bacterium]|nr:Rrf2 family transcriptional regulator [Terriglobia bacterium]